MAQPVDDNPLYALQLALLQPQAPPALLTTVFEHFQRQWYLDAVVERGLALRCGWPACGKALRPKTIKDRLRAEAAGEDPRAAGRFCSDGCRRTSAQFAHGLPEYRPIPRPEDVRPPGAAPAESAEERKPHRRPRIRKRGPESQGRRAGGGEDVDSLLAQTMQKIKVAGGEDDGALEASMAGLRVSDTAGSTDKRSRPNKRVSFAQELEQGPTGAADAAAAPPKQDGPPSPLGLTVVERDVSAAAPPVAPVVALPRGSFSGDGGPASADLDFRVLTNDDVTLLGAGEAPAPAGVGLGDAEDLQILADLQIAPDLDLMDCEDEAQQLRTFRETATPFMRVWSLLLDCRTSRTKALLDALHADDPATAVAEAVGTLPLPPPPGVHDRRRSVAHMLKLEAPWLRQVLLPRVPAAPPAAPPPPPDADVVALPRKAVSAAAATPAPMPAVLRPEDAAASAAFDCALINSQRVVETLEPLAAFQHLAKGQWRLVLLALVVSAWPQHPWARGEAAAPDGASKPLLNAVGFDAAEFRSLCRLLRSD